MSYHTPPGWAERCTMRDDRAMHQIRITVSGEKKKAPTKIGVFCTCQRGIDEPFALLEPGQDALQAWRDAEHLPQVAA